VIPLVDIVSAIDTKSEENTALSDHNISIRDFESMIIANGFILCGNRYSVRGTGQKRIELERQDAFATLRDTATKQNRSKISI